MDSFQGSTRACSFITAVTRGCSHPLLPGEGLPARLLDEEGHGEDLVQQPGAGEGDGGRGEWERVSTEQAGVEFKKRED